MKSNLKKGIKYFSIILIVIIIGLRLFAAFSGYHPNQIEDAEFQCSKAPVLKKNKISILSWNVQFLAGKNYVFFFDVLGNAGRDTRPTKKDIRITKKDVIKTIRATNADFVLVQELDRFATRTDYEDQVKDLYKILRELYPCYSTAYYWKAKFIPHPKIMGSAGLSLAIYSKYKIKKAQRYQLPLIPTDSFSSDLLPKRAILENEIQVSKNLKPLSIMVTHLSAFSQGTDTMTEQADFVEHFLQNLNYENKNWVIGGDFNLLPNKDSYERLPEDQRAYYNPQSELTHFFTLYGSVPELALMSGTNYEKWFTHFPNDPAVKKPDRTIDYIFFPLDTVINKAAIIHKEAITISDHFPVTTTITLPNTKRKK